jgi:hypothetical protein
MTAARKRLLYVGFNRAYVNRTYGVLVRALQYHHDIEFFGPGYQPTSFVQRGVESWVEEKGPYDLVLFDHYTIMHERIAKLARPFGGDVIHFTRDDYVRQAPRMAKFINEYSGIKLFLVNWDVYGIGQEWTDYLERIGTYVADIALTRMTIEERAAEFGTDQAGAEQRGFWYGGGTDHWVHFLRRNRHKVLEIPHAIGMEQFCFTPLESRPKRFAVPGTNYREREQVYDILSKRQRISKLVQKVEDRVVSYFQPSLSPQRLVRIHQRYDLEISASQTAFTSGSRFRTPVRKYFEIPALGAMPLGQRMEGFRDLGFQDGENFVIAETPEDVRRTLARFDVIEAQRIAENARSLVLEQHSEAARALQLAKSIKEILGGTFKGSYWTNGGYLHY